MTASSPNPYESPSQVAGEVLGTPAATLPGGFAAAIPDSAARRATNLIRDARLATLVGPIPILGLIFILRLVQWYLLRRQYPALVSASTEAARDATLAKDFCRALPRLWFAVLFWPGLVLFLVVYIRVT